MNEPTEPIDVQAVLVRLDAGFALLDSLRSDIAEENEKRDERIATNRRLNRWAIAAAIVGCLVGVVGLVIGAQAKSTTDDIIAARRDARLTVCEKDNTDAKKQHLLWEGLLAIPSDRPADPAKVAQLNVILDDTFPQRDCSPDAIDAFYRNGGN